MRGGHGALGTVYFVPAAVSIVQTVVMNGFRGDMNGAYGRGGKHEVSSRRCGGVIGGRDTGGLFAHNVV